MTDDMPAKPLDFERQGRRMKGDLHDVQVGDVIIEADGRRAPVTKVDHVPDGMGGMATNYVAGPLEAPLQADRKPAEEPILALPQAVIRDSTVVAVDEEQQIGVGDIYADGSGERWRVTAREPAPFGRVFIHSERIEEELAVPPLSSGYATPLNDFELTSGGAVGGGAIGEHPVAGGDVRQPDLSPVPTAQPQRKRRETFLVTTAEGSITRRQFQRLPKTRRIAAMEDWFARHYEEPSLRTGRDDGEWLWYDGGPHDAAEVLYDEFNGLAPDAWIDQLVAKLQADGITEWASIPDDQPDDEEMGRLDAGDLLPLDVGRLPNPTMAHQAMVRNLLVLEARVSAMPVLRPGMGGNQPPSPIACPFTEAEQAQILAASRAVRAQLERPPDLGAAARPMLGLLVEKRERLAAWIAPPLASLKDRIVGFGKDMATDAVKDVVKDGLKEATKWGLGTVAGSTATAYWRELASTFDGAIQAVTSWLQSLSALF